MIAEWKALLRRQSDEWGISNVDDWTFLVHNNYHPNNSGLNVFWFQRARHPLVVMKACKEPDLPRQEFRNLKAAHASAPDFVPRPLGLHKQGVFWTLWMTGEPGTRLTMKHVSEAAVQRLCDALVAIQTRSVVRMPADRFRDSVCVPLDELQSHPLLSESCKELRAKCTERWLQSLPWLPQHGDLYGGNILVAGRSWRILDWESFGQIDLPLYDVLSFWLSLANGVPPPQWGEAFRRSASGIISRYCRACGVRLKDLGLLLPLLLANRAHQRYSAERNATALALLRDYFTRPGEWQDALTSAC